MNKYKPTKLTAQNFSLLQHVLDIAESDYDVDGPAGPEPYRVKMQLKLKKLRKKLTQMNNERWARRGVSDEN